MRAVARIVAVADGARGTRLAVLRGESPLLLRRTGAGPDDRRAAGRGPGAPGGRGGGAARRRRSAARDRGRRGGAARRTERRGVAGAAGAGGEQSRLDGDRAGRGRRAAALAARAADRRRRVRPPVPLGGRPGRAAAALVWREELVCGRHGEPVGDVRIEHHRAVRRSHPAPQRTGGRARARRAGRGRRCSAVAGSPVRCCWSTRPGPTPGRRNRRRSGRTRPGCRWPAGRPC